MPTPQIPLQLRTLLRRISPPRAASSTDPGAALDFAGHRVTGLRLGGESKAGHLWWRGTVGGLPVKLYETSDPSSAELVSRLSNDQTLSGLFPDVLGHESRFVLAKWVAGRQAPAGVESAGRSGRILATLHVADAGQSTGFDYPGYLQRRFARYAGPLLAPALAPVAEEGRAALDSLVPSTHRISHPDLTFRNLVGPSIATSVVIDNELLGVGSWYPLDLVNAWMSLRTVDGSARALMDGYRAGDGDPTILTAAADAIPAVWRLRVIGSMLQAGRLGAATDALPLDRHRKALEPLFEAAV